MSDTLHVKNPEILVAQIKRDEGFRLKPYTDTVGKTTIGVGRNLTDDGISPHEADVMLRSDLVSAIHAARETFPEFDSIPAPAQEVIVGMIFNLGHHGFLKFYHMIQAIREGHWSEAARECLNSTAARQLPKRYERYAKKLRSLAAL